MTESTLFPSQGLWIWPLNSLYTWQSVSVANSFRENRLDYIKECNQWKLLLFNGSHGKSKRDKTEWKFDPFSALFWGKNLVLILPRITFLLSPFELSGGNYGQLAILHSVRKVSDPDWLIATITASWLVVWIAGHIQEEKRTIDRLAFLLFPPVNLHWKWNIFIFEVAALEQWFYAN